MAILSQSVDISETLWKTFLIEFCGKFNFESIFSWSISLRRISAIFDADFMQSSGTREKFKRSLDMIEDLVFADSVF